MVVKNNNYSVLSECRISNSKQLTKVLDLGIQPLANSLKKKQYGNEETNGKKSGDRKA